MAKAKQTVKEFMEDETKRHMEVSPLLGEMEVSSCPALLAAFVCPSPLL